MEPMKTTDPEQALPAPSELLEQLKRTTPLYKNNEEALRAKTAELDALAAKYKITPHELLLRAEQDSTFNEDYLTVIDLFRSIARLKRK